MSDKPAIQTTDHICWQTPAIHDELKRLSAQVEELTAILNSHRRQYTDGRLPTWACEATDEEIIEILLPDQEQKRTIHDLRAALTEITDLDLEGDASLADAIHIADEALNPPPSQDL